jgi:hypothetical protein
MAAMPRTPPVPQRPATATDNDTADTITPARRRWPVPGSAAPLPAARRPRHAIVQLVGDASLTDTGADSWFGDVAGR